MASETLALVVFAEQLAALAAQTVLQVRQVIEGSATQTTDQILSDADATYQTIIANAKPK
jgi:hypothetical protein